MKNILFVYNIGTNDLDGGATGQAVYDSYKAYCLRARAVGYFVVGMTYSKRTFGAGGAGAETQRLALNTLLRRDSSFCDVFVDLSAVAASVFEDNTPSATRQADGVHLTAAGYQALVDIVAPRVQPFLNQQWH